MKTIPLPRGIKLSPTDWHALKINQSFFGIVMSLVGELVVFFFLAYQPK